MAKVYSVVIALVFANIIVYRNVDKSKVKRVDDLIKGTDKELILRNSIDSLAVVELNKNIYEIKPNYHPELEKYFKSAGISPNSGYAWCGYFLHWLYTRFNLPAYGGWAADWIKQNLTQVPLRSNGFAIPRTGGSGWHVGHIHLVYDEYIITVEGNISDKLLSRKINRDKIGIKYFNNIKI